MRTARPLPYGVVFVWGVSVQGGLCQGVSVWGVSGERGLCLGRESLSRGVLPDRDPPPIWTETETPPCG